jgi:hypothetical protein
MRDGAIPTNLGKLGQPTEEFKLELQSLVPRGVYRSGRPKDLLAAARHVAESGMSISDKLLKHLKYAIAYRTRSAEVYCGGDKEHAYFLNVLNDCWEILSPKQGKPKTRVPSQGINAFMAHITCVPQGQGLEDEDFEAEGVDEEFEDEGSEDEEYEDTEESKDGQSVSECEESERMDCILFLILLDELQGFVAAKLEKAFREWHPTPIILKRMKEASVATNVAIQQVAHLEQRFVQDHPHLSTVYRVLAHACLEERIQELSVVVNKMSRVANYFTERDAVVFLGDAMECAFRPLSDPFKKHLESTLVNHFLERWWIREDVQLLQHCSVRTDGSQYPRRGLHVLSVQQIFDDVDAMVRREAPLESDASQADSRHGWHSTCLVSRIQMIGAI